MASSPINGSKLGQLPSPQLSLIQQEQSPEHQNIQIESGDTEQTLCPSASKHQSGRDTSEAKSISSPQDKSFETKPWSTDTCQKPTGRREKTVPRSLDKDLRECEGWGGRKTAWIFILALIPLGIGYYIGGKERPALPSVGIDVDVETVLHEKMVLLGVRQFPAQDGRLWRVLRASFKKVFAERRTRPTCILLVAPDKTDGTAKRLSLELLTLFLNVTNATAKSVDALDAASLDVASDADAGRKLSNYLEKSLLENRVALVHDIGKLDGKVAMSINPFCDPSDTGVRFPRSIILFTVQNTLDSETNRVAEWVAERLLKNAWEPTLGVDQASSLVSRIVETVLDVRPEISKHL